MKKSKIIVHKNKFLSSFFVFLCMVFFDEIQVHGMSVRKPTFEEIAEKIKTESDGYNCALELMPEELNKQDFKGNNLLHIALYSNKYLFLKSIIECVTNPLKILTQKNALGENPLQLAISLRDTKSTLLILDKLHHNALFWNNQNNKEIHLKAAMLDCSSDEELYKLLNRILESIDDARYEDRENYMCFQNENGDTVFHLILKNKILSRLSKSKLYDIYYYEEIRDIVNPSLQNKKGESILDLATALGSEEIKTCFKKMGLELAYNLTELKNKLEQIKKKLVTLKKKLNILKASLLS